MEFLLPIAAFLCGLLAGLVLGLRRRASAPPALSPSPAKPAVPEPPRPAPARVPAAGPSWSLLEPQALRAGELAQSASALAEAARENHESFGKCSQVAHELAAQVGKLHEYAVSASKEADSASVSAKEGISQVDRELAHVRDVKGALGRSSKLIGELREMSGSIGGFLTQISGIARKTNLLALNAGIEAARAGEAGKGFAVVANEIRVLAESSAKTVEDMTRILSGIQEHTDQVVAIIRANRELEESVELTESAGEIFGRIVEELEKNSGSLAMVGDSVSEQGRELVAFSGAIKHSMDQVRLLAESGERAALLSRSLEEQLSQLSQLGKRQP